MLQKLGYCLHSGSPMMRKVVTVTLNVISFTLASLKLVESER